MTVYIERYPINAIGAWTWGLRQIGMCPKMEIARVVRTWLGDAARLAGRIFKWLSIRGRCSKDFNV